MDRVRPPLWDFAVDVYRDSDVAEACLRLQDEHGVDVPLLLFAAWLAQGGCGLTPERLGQVRGEVADWQREVVAPLRAVRRRLKGGPPPAPSGRTDALRETVKAAELAAERVELAVLEEAAEGFGEDGGGDPDLLDRNLDAVFRQVAGRPADGEAGRALRSVAEGVRRAAAEGRFSPRSPSSA